MFFVTPANLLVLYIYLNSSCLWAFAHALPIPLRLSNSQPTNGLHSFQIMAQSHVYSKTYYPLPSAVL